MSFWTRNFSQHSRGIWFPCSETELSFVVLHKWLLQFDWFCWLSCYIYVPIFSSLLAICQVILLFILCILFYSSWSSPPSEEVGCPPDSSLPHHTTPVGMIIFECSDSVFNYIQCLLNSSLSFLDTCVQIRELLTPCGPELSALNCLL